MRRRLGLGVKCLSIAKNERLESLGVYLAFLLTITQPPPGVAWSKYTGARAIPPDQAAALLGFSF